MGELVPLSDAPDLLSIPEAAKYLRVHPNHLYRSIRRGDPIADLVIDVCGRKRIPRRRLERFLEAA